LHGWPVRDLVTPPVFRTFLKKDKTERGSLFSGMLWQRVAVVVIALVVYSVVMPLIGYLISTFCLMTLLLWILEPARKRWFLWPLITSSLTTGLSYYVFSVLLNCQFPAGLFGR